MALIIKAQMPKGCEWTDKASRTGMGYCPFKDKCMAYREELSKQYTINAHPIDYIPSDCPIIGEIPDRHGRLIDADALLPKSGYDPMMFKHKYDGDHRTQYDTLMGYEILGIVEDAPTIVEATE